MENINHLLKVFKVCDKCGSLCGGDDGGGVGAVCMLQVFGNGYVKNGRVTNVRDWGVLH